jgi:CBS domain-containing protein
MGKRDFSQVPVWSSPREVKGVVSWRTIGQRLSLGRKMGKVADFMEDPVKVKRSTSLFDAVKLIMDYDYVLVEDIDKTICGIVTSSDIGDQFSYLAEPFLRVSEIENSVRRMIHGKFSVEELKKTTAKIPVDKKIEGVYDLTFGQYIQLLSGSGWDKIKINVDQKQFVDMLDQIRQIRNDVMHFNPDGIGEEDVEKLRECMNYLHMLQEAGAF